MNKENLLNNELINCIISDTEKESNKDECKIIGEKLVQIRNCPVCNKSVTYKSRPAYKRGLEKNSLCRSCNASFISKKYLSGKKLETEQRLKCSIALSGKSNPMYGKNHTVDSREKIRKSKLGIYFPTKIYPNYKKKPLLEPMVRNCPICKNKIFYKTRETHRVADRKKSYCFVCTQLRFKRSCVSDATRNKMRVSKINYMNQCKNTQMLPTYNKFACKIIEEYGKLNGYNFQHAQNGGEYHIKELGYWVDGYDKEKNVVFEYDEPKHYDALGNLKEKDIRRMNEIMEKLKCVFYRYNERTHEIKIFCIDSKSTDSRILIN